MASRPQTPRPPRFTIANKFIVPSRNHAARILGVSFEPWRLKAHDTSQAPAVQETAPQPVMRSPLPEALGKAPVSRKEDAIQPALLTASTRSSEVLSRRPDFMDIRPGDR
ncbi:MAG: hypothetical protein OXC93_06680 [Rhodospirillaceae bacterium]|nr:hypothetical protein [Rhodospirillaceae bacterium]